jgi:hypothetical protein
MSIGAAHEEGEDTPAAAARVKKMCRVGLFVLSILSKATMQNEPSLFGLQWK